jgi:hypothetical protein
MMARDREFLLSAVIDRPHRPEPMNYAIRHTLTRFDIEQLQRSPEAFAQTLKRYMTQKLAAHLVESCSLFEVPELAYEGMSVQMEVMLNDRGAYENYIPVAKREGRDEGWKAAREAERMARPYGMEPDLYDLLEQA